MPSARGANKPSSLTLPSGTVTFLFTDIEGSTQRWEAHRDAMQQAVAHHDEIVRSAVALHNGSVFKTIGDAFCAVFSRPQDAVRSAIAAQRALAGEDFSAVGGLRARMALHTGTAQERDGDYFGPTVNRVARLLAIGHGGQVLISGTTGDLLQGDMPQDTGIRDLGEHQLRDLVRPERVYQLTAPGFDDIFPALRSLEALPNNLPRQPTAFVGRDHELSEIKALVAKSQVVTLVGTGGIGKTRAALQVGADLLDGSGDGVWFVDLAQVSSEEGITTAIASVFGIQTRPERNPLDDICQHLKNKHLLLILDNCEHLVTQTSHIVATIVKQSPRVKLLLTSREHLNLQSEHIYRMPSLAMPPAGNTLTAEEALKFGAIALFVARASALDAQFAFSDDKAAIVADICRRLDGIALAIELAAARVTILNLKQLSRRLDERFRLLTGGDRTALPRQQTMRAAIDWSYELLSEEERTIFRRLSIFQGGWTLEAASDICADGSVDDFKILDSLSSLVNKSLVVVDLGAETQRYRLLESLRQYALELSRNAKEYDLIARRHAAYFSGFTNQVADQWRKISEVEWLALIEPELDNIRAALQWALEAANDAILGAQIAENLWAYWFGQHVREGRRWLEMARAGITPQSHPLLSVALDLALSRLLLSRSWDEAFAAIERATAAARPLGDDQLLTRAVFYLGEAYLFAGRLDEAEAALTEALTIARRAHISYREASALQLLGKLYTQRKQFELARANFAASTRYHLEHGYDRNFAISKVDEASLENAAGNLERATGLAAEAVVVAQAIRDAAIGVITRCAQVSYLVLGNKFDEAHAIMSAVMRDVREDVSEFARVMDLQPCVALAIHDKKFELAAKLLGFVNVDHQDQKTKGARAVLDPSALTIELRKHVDEDRLVKLMAEGATWSSERAVEEASGVF